MSKSSASTKYINMAHQWRIQGGARGTRPPSAGEEKKRRAKEKGRRGESKEGRKGREGRTALAGI